MARAISRLPVRALLTVADGAYRRPDVTISNLHVEAFVPQEAVLHAAAAVVCHGGSGTVLGALRAGVPLIVIPMIADQVANGRMVTRAGAGLVLEPSSTAAAVPDGAASIRSAVEQVLSESAFRVAAQRVASEMRGALGPEVQLRTLWETPETFGRGRSRHTGTARA
jgi:UDP:flavonoid glycosyltransferase YjiC (YdhE family)